jgi:RNA polymerase sigma-70 factor, ECF subfamily
VIDDRRAFFTERINALVDRLYSVAMQLTRNTHDAEDLVSETVANAWQRFDQLDDPSKFDGWIMRSLSNRFISDLRRTRPEVLLDDEPAIAHEADEDGYLYSRLHSPFILWWGGPEREFINKLLREDIESAVNALSDEYRVVFILVEVLGYRYKEVADELALPIGTVRSRLNRARHMLQKALWKHQPTENGASGRSQT